MFSLIALAVFLIAVRFIIITPVAALELIEILRVEVVLEARLEGGSHLMYLTPTQPLEEGMSLDLRDAQAMFSRRKQPKYKYFGLQ